MAVWIVLVGAGAAAAALALLVRPDRSDRMVGLKWKVKRNETYWDLRIKRQGLRKESS
jgi:hypothetical protein